MVNVGFARRRSKLSQTLSQASSSLPFFRREIIFPRPFVVVGGGRKKKHRREEKKEGGKSHQPRLFEVLPLIGLDFFPSAAAPRPCLSSLLHTSFLQLMIMAGGVGVGREGKCGREETTKNFPLTARASFFSKKLFFQPLPPVSFVMDFSSPRFLLPDQNRRPSGGGEQPTSMTFRP